jgi:hypothetical protein
MTTFVDHMLLLKFTRLFSFVFSPGATEDQSDASRSDLASPHSTMHRTNPPDPLSEMQL